MSTSNTKEMEEDFKNRTIRALGNKAYRYGKHARNTPWDRQPAHKTVINMRLSIDYKRTYMGWSSMTKWSGATNEKFAR